MRDDVMNIAHTFYNRRKRDKISIRAISKLADVSTTVICAFENYKITPSINVIERICNAVGLNLHVTTEDEKKIDFFNYDNLTKDDITEIQEFIDFKKSLKKGK